MINLLQIRDFAIIDEIELEFGEGLTVLTGETGAGKSILVDALGLALGDRADAGVVRHGCKRAEISVGFDLSALTPVREWLVAQMLDEDDECLIRRVVAAEGRSRAWVNGQQVSLTTLRELGEQLIDIHGQHEHQSLMRPGSQRHLLDHHAGLLERVARTREAFQAWQQARDALSAATDSLADRAAREDLLRHQIGELEALALEPDELAALEGERLRLRHGTRLGEGTQEALALIFEGEDTAQQRVAIAVRRLEELCALDETLGEPLRLLQDADIQLSEAADALRRYGDGLEVDPARSAAIEQRVADIRELARKHRVEPDAVAGLLVQLREELAALDDTSARIDTLEAELERTGKLFAELADDLHRRRTRAAPKMARQITATMQELGMAGGEFEVALDQLPMEQARAHGRDRVRFLVSANPGQPPQALTRVASGGELSRISLAIQVIAAGASDIPCMVFDEVDSGVGGRVAEIVGRQLRALGATRQVLCVTHLPQVASLGHAHLRVSKQISGRRTRTAIEALSGTDKVDELARMLGGMEITERTRAHAEEMLAQARK